MEHGALIVHDRCAPGFTSGSPDKGSAVCPHCSSTRLYGHGTFRRKDGLQKRYLCLTCRKTFSANTGTPAAYVKYQTKFRKMVEQMQESRSLRTTSAMLGVHLSTAFRWRHRWLGDLCQRKQAPLTGRVAIVMTAVPYSEKGSRTCRGPGSWGYWNWLLRGPKPGESPFARRSFRILVDGRAISVLVARNAASHVSRVLGPRPGVDALERGISELVAQEAHVYNLGPRVGHSSIAKACERLKLSWEEGLPSDPKIASECDSIFSAVEWESPNTWLIPFRRVATKYLHHYMAWFSYQMTFRIRLLKKMK